MRSFAPWALALVSVVVLSASGCATGKGAPTAKSKVRYEAPPVLPPYEVETTEDPLAALEALEARGDGEGEPQSLAAAGGGPVADAGSGTGGHPDQATSVAVGGGAAVDPATTPLP